ncbi:MAG: hypothetical protein LUD72_01395 [Bacteroidales bacterium]|nr:hypothetical protein [Bacteroidales bacterium]
MKKGFLNIVLILGAIISVVTPAAAQTGAAYGAYSPYSVFGLGDLGKEGTAYSRGMGGVGVATRNRRYLNVMNPAALSSIDSSSFMADIGLIENNQLFRQGRGANKITSGNNTFNINDFVIAFPVYRSLCLMAGIIPYSNTGYDFAYAESDENVIGNTSTINYVHYGEGSVYNIFVAAGVEFWHRFSVGAQMDYYFGTIDRVGTVAFSDAAYQNVTSGSQMVVRGATAKLGVQYDHPFDRNLHLVVGATYKFRTKMRGTTDVYQFGDQSSLRDTVSYNTFNNKDGLKLGDEFGIGVSLRKGDKWTVEIDYLRSDWNGTGMDNGSLTGVDNTNFSTSVAHSVRVGFEIVPNRNDIRYYLRRCTYRAGVYYDQSYFKYCGSVVSSKGVTFGMTFPVYRLYNGLSIDFDFGKRGTLKNNMVREMYWTIGVGFNIHDLWFHRPKYE